MSSTEGREEGRGKLVAKFPMRGVILRVSGLPRLTETMEYTLSCDPSPMYYPGVWFKVSVFFTFEEFYTILTVFWVLWPIRLTICLVSR